MKKRGKNSRSTRDVRSTADDEDKTDANKLADYMSEHSVSRR
jgi:hypothetical protein